MLHEFFTRIAPLAVAAMSAGLAGCDGMDIKINGSEGVPLANLDTSGDAPTKLVLAGPDTVIISDGKKLKIKVSGDQAAVDALRFTLEDGTLGVMRESEGWNNKGKATVRVTMPAPETITLAGSGVVEAASLARDAEIKILGSGAAKTAKVKSDTLDVTIAGSGSYSAAGKTKKLDLTIAGAGSATMSGLKAESADIKIMGSGDAAFASDGVVDAKIMGSGDVTITGRATCKVNSMGSGTVTCQSVQEQADDS